MEQAPPPYVDNKYQQQQQQPQPQGQYYVASPQPQVYNIAPQPSAQPQVILVSGSNGGCPNCNNGHMYDDYCTCCGIFWAIVLFPIGLLCLLVFYKRRCSNCGYSN